MRHLLAASIVALLPQLALAESPDAGLFPPGCEGDPSLCDESEVCHESICVDPDDICANSDDCPPDTYCPRLFEDPEAIGLCRSIIEDRCQGDLDCSEDELCTAHPAAPECPDGDERCHRSSPLVCVSWPRFCAEGDLSACYDGEVCVRCRCALESIRDKAERIEHDAEREARVRREREYSPPVPCAPDDPMVIVDPDDAGAPDDLGPSVDVGPVADAGGSGGQNAEMNRRSPSNCTTRPGMPDEPVFWIGMSVLIMGWRRRASR